MYVSIVFFPFILDVKFVGYTSRGHTGGSSLVCMYVCIFIELHITAQSGPVILVILCHSH